MKAVVLTGPGQLEMTERPIPACGDHEVLVRVMACNLCKTDLKCLTMGQRDLVYPRVLGHEISGVIAGVGAAVTGYQEGQRVHVHRGLPAARAPIVKRAMITSATTCASWVLTMMAASRNTWWCLRRASGARSSTSLKMTR